MLSTFVYAGLCGVRSARDNGGNADWFFDNFGELQSTRRLGRRAAGGSCVLPDGTQVGNLRHDDAAHLRRKLSMLIGRNSQLERTLQSFCANFRGSLFIIGCVGLGVATLVVTRRSGARGRSAVRLRALTRAPAKCAISEFSDAFGRFSGFFQRRRNFERRRLWRDFRRLW